MTGKVSYDGGCDVQASKVDSSGGTGATLTE